jgi:hypothetical protein
MNKLTMLGLVVLAACQTAGTAQMGTSGPGGSSGSTGEGGGGGGDVGGSLEERKYWRGQMDYLQRSLDSAEQDCGVKFSFEWVEPAQLRQAAEANNNSPYGICASVIDEVDGLCREGADEKMSVVAKIKGFKCGYGNPRNLAFEGNTVVYMGNNEESNFSDWAKPWLMKNL